MFDAGAATIGTIGAASGLIGGYLGGEAQKDAAQTAASAQYANMDMQQRLAAQNRADMAPWRNAGASALKDYQNLMNMKGDKLNSYISGLPGYQAGLKQGIQANDRSAVSRGGLFSGGQVLKNYDFGNRYFGDAYNNQLNRYANLAGIGQSATNSMAGYNQNLANNMGNAYGTMGNIALGQGQNQANTYQGYANAVNSGLNAYSTMNDLKNMQNRYYGPGY